MTLTVTSRRTFYPHALHKRPNVAIQGNRSGVDYFHDCFIATAVATVSAPSPIKSQMVLIAPSRLSYYI